MRARLAELAAVSEKLRGAVKTAGVVKVLGTAALKFAKDNPLKAGAGALTAGVGTVGGVGSYRKHKAGFDPDVQKQMLGQVPVPPGSE